MGKYVIDEPLFAGAGGRGDVIGRGYLFVKPSPPAPGAGGKYRLHCIDDLECIGDAIITTDRTLHTRPLW